MMNLRGGGTACDRNSRKAIPVHDAFVSTRTSEIVDLTWSRKGQSILELPQNQRRLIDVIDEAGERLVAGG
jgi:hypothetical protein